MEEVELGGLEEDEDRSSNVGLLGTDEQFRPSYSGDKFEVCLLFIFCLKHICLLHVLLMSKTKKTRNIKNINFLNVSNGQHN